MTALRAVGGVAESELRASLDLCESIASKDRSNLYVVSQFMRDRSRYEAFIATYAVMRVIDDRVDAVPNVETLANAARAGYFAEIDRWSGRIHAAYRGQPERGISRPGIGQVAKHGELSESMPDPALDAALASAVAAYPIPEVLFTNFLDAMRFDLSKDRFETPEEFLAYAEGATVAPTTIYLFLLCGIRGGNVNAVASGNAANAGGDFATGGFDPIACGRDLGVFAYLGHILRDAVADLDIGERGRIYVPLSDLAGAGLDDTGFRDLLRASRSNGDGTDTRWIRIARAILKRAREFERRGVEAAHRRYPTMEPDCRFILDLIIRTYVRLLDRIEADPGVVLTGLHYPGDGDRVALLRQSAAATGYCPEGFEAIVAADPIQSDPRFGQYVRLVNGGRWFEAHEVLESLWLETSAAHALGKNPGADGSRREFLQGLVQLAVALEHHRRGNLAGARKVLQRAREHLARDGATGDFDTGKFMRDCDRWIEGKSERPPLL